MQDPAVSADLPEEAARTYKELFETNPDNEWNAEFGDSNSDSESGGGGGGGGGFEDRGSYLADLDRPGTRPLIDGDGFSAGDVDDWHSKCVGDWGGVL